MMSMCIEPNLQPIITRESLMSVSGASTITEDGNYQAGCCHMVRINHTTSPPATEKQEMKTNRDFWKPLTMSSLEAWVLPATKGLTLWSPPNGTSPPATSSFGLDAALIFTCMHSSMLCIGCAHSADPSTCGNNRNQYLKLPTTSPFSPFPVLVVFLHSLVSAQCSYIALCCQKFHS